MTDQTIIIGRAAIAHRLGRSERTVTRWIKAGILRASKAGPGRTALMRVTCDEIDRLRRAFGEQEVAE